MTARARIRPALDEVAAELRRRGVHVDVGMLRALRDFGLTCFDAGYAHAHTAPTIPVPADGPAYAVDDVTGKYSAQHPLAADSQVMPSTAHKNKTG